MSSLLLPALNLAVLVSILFYFTRKPVKSYVASRHYNFRQTLEEVSKLLKNAQQQHTEFVGKLRAVNVEEQAIREQFTKEAKEVSARVIRYAEERSKMIIQDAHAAAKSAADDLRTEVRTEFVQKVVSRSEGLIKEKITGEHRTRLLKEFSSQMERSS